MTEQPSSVQAKVGEVGVGRWFHAQGGLFFIVTGQYEHKRVRIVKTDGLHPGEGGRVVFEQEIGDDTFASAFLATSRAGETNGFWAFLQHWRGDIDLLHDAAKDIARAMTRTPIVLNPVIGAVYRENEDQWVLANIIDAAGDPACEHPGRGPYGIVTYSGNRDGSGMVGECHRCGYRYHTVTKSCRHEWVTTKFDDHSMEQAYRCRICNTTMTTGGYALDDPRRHSPLHRLITIPGDPQ